MVEYIYLIIGFLGLVFGAEILIRGSINLAHAFKISPFIVGVVIVAGGTSIPELAASLQAINLGVKDIVIGNVIGSNIANILLIIGVVSLIHPIVEIKTLTDSSFSLVHKAGYIVSKNISDFVAIISSIIFIYFCVKGVITYLEGLLMLVCLVVFLVSLLMKEKADFHEVPEKLIPLWLSSFFIVVGLFAVIFGSKLFINGASEIANTLGLSETVIGITIVAIGTSLPELATGLVAAFKKQTDFAIGNILGSNIYNIFGVLGISSLFADLEVPLLFVRKLRIDEIGFNLNLSGIIYDAWFVLIVTLIFVYLMRVRRRIGKKTGILFLLIYIFYIFLLV
jgi:cation:H+ antiporter